MSYINQLNSISAYFQSKVNQKEQKMIINEIEFSHGIEVALKTLSDHFSTHSCSKKEKEILFNIRQNINKLKTAKNAPQDLKKINQKIEDICKSKDIFFQAKYDYGKKSEQIGKLNRLVDFFKMLISAPFNSMLFKGTAKRNPVLEEKGRNDLRAVGGESVELKTPDGQKIEGMFLQAEGFRDSALKYCRLIEINNNDGTQSQYLILKDETPEALNFYKTFFNFDPNKPEASKKDIPDQPGQKGYVIDLGTFPEMEEIIDKPHSNPTVLLAPPSGNASVSYKKLIAHYLLRGMNVMLVDYRGHAGSEGRPTDDKTKLDLETAYQYLREMQNVENKDLLVHGYCLGGGIASDLAARRKGVNILLDRTFAQHHEVVTALYPVLNKIKPIIQTAMPWLVEYNTAKNLAQVEGHIAIEVTPFDKTIPQAQTDELIRSLPNTKKGQVVKLMDSATSEGGHHGLWLNDEMTLAQLDQFLDQTQLKRRIF